MAVSFKEYDTIVTDPVTGKSVTFGSLTTESQQTILDADHRAIRANLYGPTSPINPPPTAPPVIATAEQTSTLTTTTVTTVSGGGSRTVTNANTITQTQVTTGDSAPTSELSQAKQQLNDANATLTAAADEVQNATIIRDSADRGSTAYAVAQSQLDVANAALANANATVDEATQAVDTAATNEATSNQLQEPDPVWNQSDSGIGMYVLEGDEAAATEVEGEATLLNTGSTDIPGEINFSDILSKGIAGVKNLAGQAGNALTGLTRLASVGLGAGGSVGAGKNLFDSNTAQYGGGMSFDSDWRVRLTLPPNLASKLFTGLLAPLADERRGVIFPYTPNITVSYAADWQAQKLTHSNYASQNYNSSEVQDIQIQGTFTAQNEEEAEYLLAVLTFGKLVTKMFFGDSGDLTGNPPPILHLYGHGTYQWNGVPVVVKNFQYSLSQDVNYIAIRRRNMTRVPMVIENMSWTVAPVYSRKQLRDYNYQKFASGDLIKGGFI